MSQLPAQEAALQESADDALSLAYKIDVILNGIRLRNDIIADETVKKILNLLTVGEISQRVETHERGNVIALARAAEPLTADTAHIEEFITQCLTDATDVMSVQQLYELVHEAGYEVSRPTFVVRLHRMQKAGKLVTPTTGHYRLPDRGNRNGR